MQQRRESLAYEIYSQVDSGRIESGFFIHVPSNPTEDKIADFAQRAGKLFGPTGDLDGDKLPNSSDPRPGKFDWSSLLPKLKVPDKPGEPGRTP